MGQLASVEARVSQLEEELGAVAVRAEQLAAAESRASQLEKELGAEKARTEQLEKEVVVLDGSARRALEAAESANKRAAESAASKCLHHVCIIGIR